VSLCRKSWSRKKWLKRCLKGSEGGGVGEGGTCEEGVEAGAVGVYAIIINLKVITNTT
jgi:hypothetical protein